MKIIVVPAQAGTQRLSPDLPASHWVPACAGTTDALHFDAIA